MEGETSSLIPSIYRRAILTRKKLLLPYSFAPYPDSNERDVRFVYCAFVICHLFEAWDSIDVQAAEQYLFQCRVSTCAGLNSR